MKSSAKLESAVTNPTVLGHFSQSSLRAILSSCAFALSLGFSTPSTAQLLSGPSSQVTEYPLPNLLAGSCEIEFDHNGMAWIEEVTGNAISRFDPQSGTFTRYPLSQPLAVPGGVEIGPDGGVW